MTLLLSLIRVRAHSSNNYKQAQAMTTTSPAIPSPNLMPASPSHPATFIPWYMEHSAHTLGRPPRPVHYPPPPSLKPISLPPAPPQSVPPPSTNISTKTIKPPQTKAPRSASGAVSVDDDAAAEVLAAEAFGVEEWHCGCGVVVVVWLVMWLVVWLVMWLVVWLVREGERSKGAVGTLVRPEF